MRSMEYVYALGLVVIVALCIAGIFNRRFDDNLLQRVGLSFLASGCMALLYMRFNHVEDAIELKPRIVTQIGILFYALGTALKVWSNPK